MDWQGYLQRANIAVAAAERRKHTGTLKLSVDYRNGVPRRGHTLRVERRVLNREPVAHSIERPDLEFERRRKDILLEGANADSQISIVYTFFDGVVVDILRETLNITC